MATPLFFIADVRPSGEGADTKLNGLDPPLLERPFIASLTHVSVRISSRFCTVPANS